MKDRVVEVLSLIHEDMKLLAANAQGKKKRRMLDKDERRHALALLELYLTQQKLVEGKPTSIVKNDNEYRIVVPKGVEEPWVIPPDPRVTIIRETEDTPLPPKKLEPEQLEMLAEQERKKKG